MLRSPLDRLPKRDPAETARFQAHLDEMAARHRREWPAIRRRMLNAAQRAQDARSRGIPLIGR